VPSKIAKTAEFNVSVGRRCPRELETFFNPPPRPSIRRKSSRVHYSTPMAAMFDVQAEADITQLRRGSWDAMGVARIRTVTKDNRCKIESMFGLTLNKKPLTGDTSASAAAAPSAPPLRTRRGPRTPTSHSWS
jgi:hypothetical protein